MSFNKKTINEYDLNDKKVLIRADYNVPLDDNGEITDDYRIQKSLPTIQALLDRNCRIVICSHLGRPKNSDDKSCSLAAVAKRLGELLGQEVAFVNDCVGEQAEAASGNLQPRQILLLENLRFHPEEEADDETFAANLAKHAEVFVQDGFGVVHRAHASTVAITHYLPSIAGLLLEKEVDTITTAMENPERPLVAIIGGAKIADKIDILNRFIDIADVIAIGGAMANTFLLAEGINIGKSLADPDDVPLAKDIMEKAKAKSAAQRFIFYLPQDGVVAKSLDEPITTRIVDWSAHVIADIESYPKIPPATSSEIAEDEKILDIGPFSGAFIAGSMQLANTVIWNGTLGVTETQPLQGPVGPFSHGTELIIDAMLGQYGHKPFSIVGGGDTVGYVEERKLVNSFGHVSTGGGASLELMSGKILPGVEALINKDA
jgi:phosphoglycerate kinase